MFLECINTFLLQMCIIDAACYVRVSLTSPYFADSTLHFPDYCDKRPANTWSHISILVSFYITFNIPCGPCLLCLL